MTCRLKQHVTTAAGTPAGPNAAATAAAAVTAGDAAAVATAAAAEPSTPAAAAPLSDPFLSATPFNSGVAADAADAAAAAPLAAGAVPVSTPAAAPSGGLVGAVVRLAPAAAVRTAVLADGAPAAGAEPPIIAAMRASGLVSIMEQDRYVSTQQATCVPGSALAGAQSPDEVPAAAWPGCAGPGATLVWFGDRCSIRFDRARYAGVYAVDKGTGAPIPGCLMTRNRTAAFNQLFLGDCGTAPTIAPALPVTNICAPAAQPGAACAAAKDVAGGLAATLPAPASCGAASGQSVVYKGVRCGPRQALIKWTRYSVAADGAVGPSGTTCARNKVQSASFPGVAPLLAASADMIGSCGVPPMANKALPVEVCPAGTSPPAGAGGGGGGGGGGTSGDGSAAPAGLKLPLPVSVLPTEAQKAGETVPWGVARIESNLGKQVTKPLDSVVAVLDTGIDDSHPDLVVAGGVSWVGTDWRDRNGHGTHVSGTIGAKNTGAGVVGVAPGTPLFALRVLDENGSGTFASVIQALLWLAKNGRSKGIRVVNLSLGGEAPANAAGSATCAAVKQVVDAGIVVVAAAGNAIGTSPRSWTTQLPAACPDVIVATAITSATGGNSPATFSYFLSAADSADERARTRTFAGPGVDIRSSWPVKLAGANGAYRTLSGTSMAAPHISAVVAKCFSAGVCTDAGAGTAEPLATAARARNIGDANYGYKTDPFFGRSKVGAERYYGALIHAGWRPATSSPGSG